MDKFSEKLNSRPLVQEEHRFQKGHNVPPSPCPQELKKCLAWIGLTGVSATDESDVLIKLGRMVIVVELRIPLTKSQKLRWVEGEDRSR